MSSNNRGQTQRLSLDFEEFLAVRGMVRAAGEVVRSGRLRQFDTALDDRQRGAVDQLLEKFEGDTMDGGRIPMSFEDSNIDTSIRLDPQMARVLLHVLETMDTLVATNAGRGILADLGIRADNEDRRIMSSVKSRIQRPDAMASGGREVKRKFGDPQPFNEEWRDLPMQFPGDRYPANIIDEIGYVFGVSSRFASAVTTPDTHQQVIDEANAIEREVRQGNPDCWRLFATLAELGHVSLLAHQTPSEDRTDIGDVQRALADAMKATMNELTRNGCVPNTREFKRFHVEKAGAALLEALTKDLDTLDRAYRKYTTAVATIHAESRGGTFDDNSF